MSKAVFLSLRPKWCELIANGKKTVEIRKTAPKLETPFKCYIYCTQERVFGELLLTHDKKVEGRNKGFRDEGDIPLAGKIIGEFICNKIEAFRVFENGTVQDFFFKKLNCSCLSYDEISEYIGKGNVGYSWEISELVIYDTPKEFCEFYKPYPFSDFCLSCERNRDNDTYDNEMCSGCDQFKLKLKRVPQSWCYVEGE